MATSGKIISLVEESTSAMHKVRDSYNNDFRIYVQKCITKHLSRQEQEVIDLIYFESLSFANVAQKLGVSRQWIWKLDRKIRKKLKKYIMEFE